MEVIRKLLILALLLSAFACTSGPSYWPMYKAPEEPGGTSMFHDRASSYSSPNGFRVVVVNDPAQKDVRMEVRYTVGSGQDPAGKEGLAHVVEHLLFEVPVSDEPGADSYGQALSRIGFHWNAYTTQDATSYLSVFPQEALPKVIALEMVRAKRGCRGLTEAQFLREREIVRNETRQRNEGETGQIGQALEEFLYVEGHPYRSSVLGTDASISAITRSDVCRFIEEHYHPKNTILVVSGPVKQSEVATITQRWFPSFPSKSPPITVFPNVSFRTEQQSRTRLNIGTPYLFVLWPLDPRETDAHHVQRQIRYGLSQEIQKLIKKSEWGTNAGTFIMGGAKAPALVASIELQSIDNLSDAKQLIHDAKKALIKRKGDFQWTSFEQRGVVQRFENLGARTALMADYEQHRDTKYLRKHFGRYYDIPKEDLKNATEAFFKENPDRFLVVDPETTSAERKAETFQYQAESPKNESFLEPDAETIKQANAPLALPEALGGEQDFRRYRLPGGLNLLLWVRPELPLVYGRLIVPVGASQVPPQWQGLSKLLPGADDYDVTVFSQTTLSKNADALMYFLADAFHSTKRVLDTKQLEWLRGRLEQEQSKSSSNYATRLNEAVYGASHPYTRVRLQSEQLDQLTKKAASSWARKARSIHGATLVLTGRFDPDLMYKQVLYYFRHSSTHSLEEYKHPSVPLPNHDAVVTRVDEQRSSLSISMIFRGGRGVDASQPARDLLAAILRDRLRQLREEQALTYGMNVRYIPERGDGLWWISGDVDAARSGEAMRLLLDTITELRNNPNSYVGQFAKARQQRMNQVGQQKVTAAVAAARLTYLARYNLEDDYYENYVRALAQTTPADVQRLLTTEFDRSHRVVGLVGPAASIGAAKVYLGGPATPAR